MKRHFLRRPLLRRLLSGTVLRRRLKKILEKYATSERVERAEVAGLATKKQKADMRDSALLYETVPHICRLF